MDHSYYLKNWLKKKKKEHFIVKLIHSESKNHKIDAKDAKNINVIYDKYFYVFDFS